MSAPWAPMVVPPLPGHSELHDTCEAGWQQPHTCDPYWHTMLSLMAGLENAELGISVEQRLACFPYLDYDAPSGVDRTESQPLV
jgi:hypothetical protein